MTDARDIELVLREALTQGARVWLEGAQLNVDLSEYDGAAEAAEILRRRNQEAAGYLALQRPRRVLPPIERGGAAADVRLSIAQRQWADPDRNPLQEQWLPVVWKLEGLLNIDAFKQSFQHLLERHPVLRTGIVPTGAGMASDPPLGPVEPLEIVDLTGLPADYREREIWKRMRSKYEVVTSLANGVTDLKLYRTAEREHILGGFIHHIAMDAASLAIVLGELMARYYGGLFGKETGEEEAIRYADFVRWENSWLTESERGLSDCMWLYQLAAARVPPDRSPAARGSPHDHDVLPIVLPKETHDVAVRRARESGVTLNMYFLTVLAVALAQLRGAHHALFGHICRGRPPGFETVVGSFIQMRPFFLAYDPGEAFSSLLKRGRRMFSTSADLGRPISPQLAEAFGVGRIVVNFSQRGDGQSKATTAASLSKNSVAAVRGVYTTTTHRPPGDSDRRPASQRIPTFFSASSMLPDAGALSRPEASGLSVRRRQGVGMPAPRKLLGLSAAMSRLPERLQTEFHRDLHFAMTQTDASLSGVVTFNRQSFSRAEVLRLIADIIRLFDAGARDPAAPLSTHLRDILGDRPSSPEFVQS